MENTVSLFSQKVIRNQWFSTFFPCECSASSTALNDHFDLILRIKSEGSTRKSWKLRLWTSSERRIPEIWSLIVDIAIRLERLTQEIASNTDQGMFTSISLVSKCNPWATFFRRILGVFARDERIWYPGCHRLPFSREEEEKEKEINSAQKDQYFTFVLALFLESNFSENRFWRSREEHCSCASSFNMLQVL